MSSRARWLLLLVSTPLVVLAAVGGLMGATAARDQTAFPHLSVFDDVVRHILGAYVEPVDVDKVMDGAMRGLVDGLDSSSAYLNADDVKSIDSGAPPPAGETGLVVTRLGYLRVVSAQDGSAAEKAGLRTGDIIRAIAGTSTREMSAWTGTRLLRGAPGSSIVVTVFRTSPTEAREFTLVRTAPSATPVSAKKLPTGEGYVRIARFDPSSAATITKLVDGLKSQGVTRLIVDVRGTAVGAADDAIATARLFVKSGTLTVRAGRAATDKTTVAAAAGDGAITMPVAVLISNGTAGPGEVFAGALGGNKRADLVGQITSGLASDQHLVRLPEGTGLWMTYRKYLMPDNTPIMEHGVLPTVGVDLPFVDFDDVPPATDKVLAKALETLKNK